MAIRQVAIVGGGPSGAMCGEKLARAGFEVTLYDEHLAWEKPCGGGLTHKAVVTYPFLLDGPQPKKLVHTVELISSRDHRARLKLDHPIVIYSRAVLNKVAAAQACGGGRFSTSCGHDAPVRVDTSRHGVRLVVGGATQEVDFVVIATREGAQRCCYPARPLELWRPGDDPWATSFPARPMPFRVRFPAALR